jgi:ABC-2 type transport system permease protein
VGSLLAGVGATFHAQTALLLALTILVTSLGFNTMMFLLMVRVEDPLVPRATFGVLNTLLFFPSGAIYPINAFPKWLQAIAIADPFSYAVHAFKALLLKEAGFTAIWYDLLFLTIFAAVMISIATPLFKRTL